MSWALRTGDRFERLLPGASFADWLDGNRPVGRRPLQPHGRIGTAHNSIDRPLDIRREA